MQQEEEAVTPQPNWPPSRRGPSAGVSGCAHRHRRHAEHIDPCRTGSRLPRKTERGGTLHSYGDCRAFQLPHRICRSFGTSFTPGSTGRAVLLQRYHGARRHRRGEGSRLAHPRRPCGRWVRRHSHGRLDVLSVDDHPPAGGADGPGGSQSRLRSILDGFERELRSHLARKAHHPVKRIETRPPDMIEPRGRAS